MKTAGRLYRLLLHLYPAEHRETYGEAMLQHAQDLERDARDRGRLAAAALALRLIGDGILNAGKEQWAALRASHFDPVPWPAVLMAAVPGLWMALTRRHADLFGPALNVLGVVYIALFALIPPIMVWRRRRFPVWALLPLGMLAWALTFMAGTSLAALAGPVRLPGLSMAATTILNGMLVAGIFYTMLRGERFPRSALIVVGLILLSGLLPLVQLSQHAPGYFRPHEILAAALFEPLQALMLVAVGLLAARRYNVLALLAVFGGTMLLFGDSDYLWGSPYRDWPGLPLYMAGMVFLFFVLAPAGLLRAKTDLGRATAVFVPAIIFLAARIVVPALVLGDAARIYPGEIVLSGNILLSLLLGWILYRHIGRGPVAERLKSQTAGPLAP